MRERGGERRPLMLEKALQSTVVSSGRRRLVRRQLRRADAGAGRGLVGDQARPPRLIAAPTGSGKTLAAFLAAIDSLVEQGVAGGLPDETQVVYVSPLKALSQRHPEESRGAARRHPRSARGARAARRRHPHLGPHRRHALRRARPHAPAAAAYRGDDAGVALRAARLRIRARRCWRRRGP